MNVLTRVSGLLTNASYMLNVDRDMFANNPQIVLHDLCLFLGTESEVDCAFVQSPQKFVGIMGLNNHHDANNDLNRSKASSHKLGEDMNISINSYVSLQMSNDGGSVTMSVDNSCIASNESYTQILNHHGLRRRLTIITLLLTVSIDMGCRRRLH
ncbi:hypothetical protein MLD38_037377 [Melastoma candidum]|uniref:Uncharacterized protein n=1 Tax=Melastoma candidum TaxID=119954 RepID=A0ACB9LLW0_9MYRT|nr:hypothetical protein MLD38_037377 [Melastoma candidum]